MIAVGELGLGDSRYMSPLAEKISNLIFFGGLGYIIFLIISNNKRLHNKPLLLEKERGKLDERQQFLHDKSGGTVVDILLLMLLFITCTTALCNTPAFYISLTILVATVVLKAGSYILYCKYH